MKKISIIFAFLLAMVAVGNKAQAQCTDGNYNCYLVIEMLDSYGDGWNGNTVTVTQNSTLLATLTVSDGGYEADTVRICTADGPITVSYNNIGMYPSENSFTVADSLGSVLYNGYGDYSSYSVEVDPCPSCPSPVFVQVSNVTSSSATVSWTEAGSANAWLYMLSATPFPVGDWQYSTNPSVNLTGLNANTQYYIFMRSYCDVGDTSTVVSTSFRTACGLITLPVFESFEDNGYDMPFCWQVWESSWYVTSWDMTLYPRVAVGYSMSYPTGHESLSALQLNSEGGANSIMSPKMPLQANQLEVMFWYKGPHAIQVGYTTTADSATAVFHEVATVGPTPFDYDDYDYYWQQGIISFDTVTETDSIYVVFRCPQALAENTSYIDEITIRQHVNCSQASNLAVVTDQAITGQVTLTWDDTVGTNWEIAYGPQGFDPDMTTNYWPATSTTATVTGLDDNTTYQFYVRAVCGTEHGYWSNSVMGRPNVYAVTDAVDTITTCGLVITDDGGYFGQPSEYMTQIIVLQPSDANSAIRIQGDAYLYSSYSYYVNHMRIFAGSDTNGMLLLDVNSIDAYNIDITSEVGPMTIWYSTASYNEYVGDGFAFAVSCEDLPSCTTPYNLAVSNIEGTTANVSWAYNTILGEATGFTLYVRNHTTNDEDVIPVSGELRSYTLTGLSERTTYTVRLALDCDGIDTSSVHFTTGCTVGGDIQVGSGTTTASYLPTYLYYGNTLSQQLFTATDLDGITEIFGFRFYQTSSEITTDRLLDVYMDTTSLTSYTGTSDYVAPTAAKRHFSGSVHCEQGWVEVTFDSSFVVPAGKSVVLTVSDHTGSYVNSTSNRITNTAEPMAMYRYRDGSAYDATNPTEMDGASLISYRNSIVFLTPCAETSCLPPSALVAVPDTHTVVLTWLDSPTATAYKVEYRNADSTAWIEVAASTTNDTYTVTGLAPATQYVFRVSSLCSDTIVANTTTAKTLCGRNDLPFTESFVNFHANSYNDPTIEDCWYRSSQYPYSGSYYPYTSSYEGYDNSWSMEFYGYRSTLVMPEMDAPSNNLEISFALMRPYSEEAVVEVGICTDPANASTYTVLQTINIETETYEWAEYTIYTDNYLGADGQIFFRAQGYDYIGTFYLDKIQVDAIPSCRNISNLQVDNISSTSITVVYTDEFTHTGYTVFWGTTDDVTFATDSMTVTGLTATITGLTPATTYYVWVRGNCGTDRSRTVGVEVSTACAAIQITENEPYLNEFESDVNDCLWQRGQTGGISWKYYQSSSSSYSSVPAPMAYSGSSFMRLASKKTGEAMLVLPAFNFSAMTADAEVSFYQNIAKKIYDTYNYDSVPYPLDELQVYYRVGETGPWTMITTIDTNVYNVWKRYFVSLPNSIGVPVYQVAFKGISNGNPYGINIDDVKVSKMTTCLPPSGVTVTNVTDRTATVHWSGTADAYKVQYRPVGNWTWNARTVEHIDSLVISPMDMATEYEVRVRAVCGAIEQSEYSDIVRFSTEFCIDRSENSNYTAASVDTVVPNIAFESGHYYGYSEVLIDSAGMDGMFNVNGLSFTIDSFQISYSSEIGVQIYMGNVSNTINNLGAFTYDTTFVNVYNGVIPYSVGQQRILFDNPFEWDGSSNVVIGFLTTTNNYSTMDATYFASHKTTGAKTYKCYYNNMLTPDMANSLAAGNKAAINAAPDITLYGCNPVCYEPVVSKLTTSAESIGLEWYNENAVVQIQIKEASATVWDDAVVVNTNHNNTHSYTYTQLAGMTDYNVRLRRDCTVEEIGYSDWVEFLVHTDTMCSIPENINVTVDDANTVTVGWTDGAMTGGRWEIHIWNNDESHYFDVTTNPATVTGLTAGYSYRIAVRAYCGSYDHVVGEYSETIVFDNVCYPVTALQAHVNGPDVVLTWTPGSRNNSWLVSYGYQGYSPNEPLGYMIVNTPTATIPGLAAAASPYAKGVEGNTYAFRVRAICAEGWNSPWADEVTATIEGIDDVENANTQFTLQPNPATERVMLRINDFDGVAKVNILSVDGRMVNEYSTTDNTLSVDVSSMATGTYFVRVQTDGWVAVRKLVVK